MKGHDLTQHKSNDLGTPDLVAEIRGMIEETRAAVAKAVNVGLTILYWKVGRRINEDALHQGRAEYGKKILPTLSAKLTAEYGRGWSERNLAYMIRFAEVFPDQQILHTLCAKLSWSHFRQIIYFDALLKRDFYAEMCRVEGWSVRTLRKKIDSMLYERTAISKKPGEVAKDEPVGPKLLRITDIVTGHIDWKDVPYCERRIIFMAFWS